MGRRPCMCLAQLMPLLPFGPIAGAAGFRAGRALPRLGAGQVVTKRSGRVGTPEAGRVGSAEAGRVGSTEAGRVGSTEAVCCE